MPNISRLSFDPNAFAVAMEPLADARRIYRWWGVIRWRDRLSQGVKFGPVTVARYRAFVMGDTPRWWLCVSVLGHTLYDGWVRAVRRGAR